jgi:RHH-type proline utilization regulon transcriptional repressor/proline dehydrogenase/delta 1-pyrroline-5-carboxylate dehydrogenase
MATRRDIRAHTFADEAQLVDDLTRQSGLSAQDRADIAARGAGFVQNIRDHATPNMMELFLSEYGLSSDEGIALMCLAEALLRVPDTATIDALINDKIAPNEWAAHLGQSHSPLINASTWGLMLTGKVLDNTGQGVSATLRAVVKRLGEPVIRKAAGQAMRQMGRQFVLGETMDAAMKRATAMQAKGYTYSYDMLGEAARTDADAKRYHMAYADAIADIAHAARAPDPVQNPGISIKLSALHPRYDPLQKARMMDDLVPRVLSLVMLAKSANIGLNIDAEESARLDLSLDIIDAVLSNRALAGWDGFGVVVQAYSKRALPVIDWLYARAGALDRRIMVRLVKGAYWDTEIKLAQVDGLPGFPVFTTKPATDISYITCARRLFDYADRIYPQFATHNAHTAAAILGMAPDDTPFEFQRLHGMGDALHDVIKTQENTRCRIYAPVGAHRDLLAYLVRRLLENGANSSFVNQIVDVTIPAKRVARDPVDMMADAGLVRLKTPDALFLPDRQNSTGVHIADPDVLADLMAARDAIDPYWGAGGVGAHQVMNPATGDAIGQVVFLSPAEAIKRLEALTPWSAPAQTRAQVLNKAADLFEMNRAQFFALLAQEAGKTLTDCIGELREAVDFLRYYAAQITRQNGAPLGTVLCISPWNFPLAIFTGQIAAALAAGNAVLAKPAESTSLIAQYAVDLLYQAGVARDALALACGQGGAVGPGLCAHPKIAGVAFTGSTATAQAINRSLADHQATHTPLIAETGGINAMIVDSTALLEQAVRDIVVSAFQSAGQRCSALRVLYVQQDIAHDLQTMLFGAMQALVIGNPSDPATDIGPVIDARAQAKIAAYIANARDAGRLVTQMPAPDIGHFIGPAVIAVDGIEDIPDEIFGPVLHIATFKADQLDDVITQINAAGYGLTFGLHSRIDARVQHVIDRVNMGNIYVNRNQIGAIVGSQPFGGHGLSGTGPKAGGPRYMAGFCRNAVPVEADEQVLPGPTGESNLYRIHPRQGILCAGPGADAAAQQAQIARDLGCRDITVDPNAGPDAIAAAKGLSVILYWGDVPRDIRQACAGRAGAIVKLVTHADMAWHLCNEQTICIDTTASGGNAELLGAHS